VDPFSLNMFLRVDMRTIVMAVYGNVGDMQVKRTNLGAISIISTWCQVDGDDSPRPRSQAARIGRR
jgi:hypothetical protein